VSIIFSHKTFQFIKFQMFNIRLKKSNLELFKIPRNITFC